jgi:hypothetical protein
MKKNSVLLLYCFTIILISASAGCSISSNDQIRRAVAEEKIESSQDSNKHSDKGGIDGDKCSSIANPDKPDMDEDGIIDECDDDIDGDGLLNEFEDKIGTDKRNPDTDGDKLIDSDELRFGTDPKNPDTNGDGISDYDQIITGKGCR